MNKGFVIVAANSDTTNYVLCAITLAGSLKRTMPYCSVTLITNKKTATYVENIHDQITNLFDYIQIDSKDRLGFELDSAVYELSPYEHTIKIEADIYVPQSLEHWWDILVNQPLSVVVSTTIRDHTGKISDCRYYRPIIDANKLPDTYNAITYFRKDERAKEFFDLTEHIYTNWSSFVQSMRMRPDEEPATDEIYAIASAIIGEENTTLPTFTDFSMAHMKKAVLNTVTENWTEEFTTEILPYTMRISNFTQLYPVHYYNKEFCHTIETRLEKYNV